MVVSVVTRSCMIVSDAIVILVTWIKTWSTIRIAERLNVKMSFTNLILKEGILYFRRAACQRVRLASRGTEPILAASRCR